MMEIHRRNMILSRLLALSVAAVLGIEVYFRLPETVFADTIPPQPEAVQVRSELDQAMALLRTCFGTPVQLDRVRSLPVTLTAYSSTVSQCDETPHYTASDQAVRNGIVAVSDDLVREMGLRFGQKVLIPGYGIFEVQDRMNPRWRRTVDIWISDQKAASLFGKQKGILLWVAEPDRPEPKLKS